MGRIIDFPDRSVRGALVRELVIHGYRDGGPVMGGIIQGPIESGKSVAALACLYAAMCLTPRWDNGVRRSRWLASRTTYPELETSTIKTWLDWFPEDIYGKFSWSEPYTHKMRFLDVAADVVFQSFADDKPDTLKALRSTEWTGAWINEGQFIPRRLFMEMSDRTGRYPPVSRGGSGRKFMVMDMNAPNYSDHWVLRMRGDVELPPDMPQGEKAAYDKPSWLKFYTQPAAIVPVKDATGKRIAWAINPKAENLENMKGKRYLELTEGKTDDEVRRDLGNEVVEAVAGSPCFPNWDTERHSTPEELEGNPFLPLIIGFDWGATPAAAVWQNVAGQWRGIGELVEKNCLIVEFAPKMRHMIATRWPWAMAEGGPGVIAWGDPEGGWPDERTGETSYGIMRHHGLLVRPPAIKDSPQLRLEMGRKMLNETLGDGSPRVLVSRHPNRGMPRFVAAMAGGYVLEVKRVEGQEKVKSEPRKNMHSHIAEAGCYAWWGGGEARATMGRSPASEARKVNLVQRRLERRTYRIGARR